MPIKFPGARRRALTLPLLALLSLTGAFAQRVDRAQAARLLRQPNVSNQFIVKFYDPEFAPDPDALAAYVPGGIRHLHAIGGSGVHLLKTNAGGAAVLAELSQHPAVEFIEPDYIVSIDRTTNDPLSSQLWALGSGVGTIGATLAWNVTTGSRAVAVAVLDTGADLAHPDLAANLWRAPAPFRLLRNGASITCPAGSPGFDFVNNDCLPNDDNGHGSHVAGSIGAVGNNSVGVVGVNWRTTLVPLKFLAANGSGSSSDAIAAIDLAIALRTQFPTDANIQVLNNSWGGGSFSSALASAIGRARAMGLLMVFAAGNEARNNDISSALAAYERSYDNMLTVAATDRNDNLASFSNFGATSVHLGAPGVGIVSTSRDGTYASLSGSSMAAAYASGAAALLLAACPVSAQEVRYALMSNADASNGLTGRVRTGGRLNVDRALQRCATPSVALNAAPSSLRVRVGLSGVFTLTPQRYGSVTAPGTIQITGTPTGVTLARAANTAFGAPETLTVNVGATVPTGTYTLTATLTAGTFRATTPLTLVVDPPPSFTLPSVFASVRLTQGSRASLGLSIIRDPGFTAPVSLQLADLPVGVTSAPVTIPAGSNTAIVPLTVAANAAIQSFSIRVLANSSQPTISKSSSFNLEVTAVPTTLQIAVSPLLSVARGRSLAVIVTVGRLGNANGPVTVTVPGLPNGVTASTLTIPAGANAGVLTVSAAASTPLTSGTPLRLTATMANPALTATTTAMLRVF
jgi:subtilisin family serine protease